MIYYTGDIHGNPVNLIKNLENIQIKNTDTLIILGDVGANYYLNKKDMRLKEVLNSLGPSILCIHGNHEARPQSIPTYQQKVWNGGIVFYEEVFPNLLFAKDGEIFNIEGLRHIAIGGAYSVDKEYRLLRGYQWFADEQPSTEIKEYVVQQLNNNTVDIILSHTCPLRYEPIEMYLSMIDQRKVDKTTEEWLDKIEEKIDYKAWFCGHWHINKRIDKMHFLFDGIESSEYFYYN